MSDSKPYDPCRVGARNSKAEDVAGRWPQLKWPFGGSHLAPATANIERDTIDGARGSREEDLRDAKTVALDPSRCDHIRHGTDAVDPPDGRFRRRLRLGEGGCPDATRQRRPP
jgi:hypothetical protein